MRAKKATYDLKLADSGAFQLGRAKSSAQQNLDEYFGRATEHLRANNFVGSVLWLRKCVEIAPGEAKYRALLARSLGTIPQFRDEAIEQFESGHPARYLECDGIDSICSIVRRDGNAFPRSGAIHENSAN